MCLFCAAGLTHGTNGEISWTDSQRVADAVRSIVLETAVLHTGDVVQGFCSGTSGERWSKGVHGGMEMLGLASRTDLADTQYGSVARALELQLRGRDGGSNDTVRPRHRPVRGKRAARLFPENIRIGVPLRMLPDGPLNQHVVLNSARLTTWAILKAEIDNVRRAQAAASSTPQPMDLSAYVDNLPTTPCPVCGKAGYHSVRNPIESSFDFLSLRFFFFNDSNFWYVQSSMTCNDTIHVLVLWPVCAHRIPIQMLLCP